MEKERNWLWSQFVCACTAMGGKDWSVQKATSITRKDVQWPGGETLEVLKACVDLPMTVRNRFEKWSPVTKPLFPSWLLGCSRGGPSLFMSVFLPWDLAVLPQKRAGSTGYSWVAASAKACNLGCDRTRGISLQLWQLLAGCWSVSSLSHLNWYQMVVLGLVNSAVHLSLGREKLLL